MPVDQTRRAVPARGADAIREELARRMVSGLPRFGSWASAVRDFETPHGKVGLRQLAILWVIRHETFPPDAMSAATLATLFKVQPSVVTKALARLERSGFVTRTIDPRDSRRALITITDRGIEVSRFVEQQFVTDMAESLAGIDGVRLDELARVLDVLDAVADDLIGKLDRSRKPTRQRRGTLPSRPAPDRGGGPEWIAPDGEAGA